MRLSGVAYYVGQVFLLLTVASALLEAWRQRDRHRLDILFVVGLLALLSFVRVGRNPLAGALILSLRFAQQFFLLRLVGLFRDVPKVLQGAALAAVPAAFVGGLMVPVGQPGPLSGGVATLLFAIQALAALVFTQETRRAGGVTARRLIFAATGTWAFAATQIIAALGAFAWWTGTAGFDINEVLTAVMLICYFLAFATPRRLRAAWQRDEQALFLTFTADRDPEERGRRAAYDLQRAVTRGLGSSLAVVALRRTPAAPELVVRTSTDPSLLNLRIGPAEKGAIGRVSQQTDAISATPEACEAELAPAFRAHGVTVLVAPIATAAHSWGAVAVVQRRGSLFPEDDRRLLAQLGRYSAMALDHAQLVSEARARARQVANRRLREVESRMSLMLDSIKDYAMIVLDQHGHVAAWHAGATHVFGWGAEEVVDQSAARLFDMTDDQLRQLLDVARQDAHAEREGPCRRQDGRRFTGATILRPLAAEEGHPPGFVAVTRDVTQQRDLEDRLRQSQKMEAIGQLAGGIAHDFNNLLTAILGYADWLEQNLAEDDVRRQEVQEIQKAGERAASLTRQLLAFSRRQMLQATPIDLTALVHDLLPMLRRVIHEQIEIVEDTSDVLSRVLGDRSQVEQIVVNLVVNARDAMPAGGRLTIRTSDVWLDEDSTAGDATPGAYVLLEVQDTGVGMDESTRLHSFEPFFTTKEVGRGTGLGLSTVYGIVKQMAGLVRVDSEPDRGSRFRLYFPRMEGEAEAVPPPVRPARLARGNETLLLVEDDEAVRTFLARALEHHGYAIVTAEHAGAALALDGPQARAVDLVISDVVLPGRTGVELVRELTRLRPDLPALFISGYADGVRARDAAFPASSHFLQKPFSVAELLAKIREILPMA